MRASEGLQWRSCDEGVLVFDEKNGTTSLLNHQSARLLSTLSSERDVDEAVVRAALGMTSEMGMTDVNAVVISLRDSGLIVC